MNFKRTKQILILAVLTGVAVTLHAENWVVTGSQTPDRRYQPHQLKTLQEFLQSHPTGLTREDMDNFSAAVVHNYAASASKPVSKDVAAVPAPSQNSDKTQAQNSADQPCPTGFHVAQSNLAGGTSTCDQRAPRHDGTELDTTLTVDASGHGILNHSAFGDMEFEYGSIVQRVVDNRPGHILYPAEYDNYFVADAATANALEKAQCGAGFPVTYAGPSGGGGGYQVQVAACKPGADCSPDNPSRLDNLSPLPPGDTNLCLTVPPPSSSN